MAEKKETALAPAAMMRDPFALLRQMTAELDRAFDDPFFRGLRWAPVRPLESTAAAAWAPKVDVFEKDGRLITRVDLPGVKKEDVTVEVAEGQLVLSGERKHEVEEKKDNVYRSERQYGSFYRAVPLPEGVKLEDVKATYSGGVLEVSVPLPSKAQATARKVEIQEPAPGARAAAPAA
jgi:HSP20 family protein